MNILFDNVALHQDPYVVNTIRHEQTPDRDIFSGVLARERGAFVMNTAHRSKVIVVTGYIKATSAMELDQYIDEAKELFSREKRPLDIDYAGTTRRYFVTSTAFKCDREHYHITFVPFTAEFLVPDGVGINPSHRIHEVTDVTDAEKSETVTVYGSAYPEYSATITINTAGGMTELTFTIGGDMITCPATFQDGDVLIIESKNYTVSLNGTVINYEGIYPRLNIGQNVVIVRHDGTSADYDLLLLYAPTYL